MALGKAKNHQNQQTWHPLRTSCRHLGPTYLYLGPLLAHLGADLGSTSASLGFSWASLGPLFAHLGHILAHLRTHMANKIEKALKNTEFFHGFCKENDTPNLD